MIDTMFKLENACLEHAVRVHVKSEDGAWGSAGLSLNQELDRQAGGHGLFSTPRDYVRFQRSLLCGGGLDGMRVLSEEPVDAALSNQIGAMDFPAEIPTADPATTDSFAAGPGWNWGCGLLLNTEDLPGGGRAGTGSWAGLFNTHFSIDRTSGVCASVYTNSPPFVERDGAWKLYQHFEQVL